MNSFFLSLFAVLICFLSISCAKNQCPDKEIDCQVYLQQGQKSPYRNVTAKNSGWSFAGHVSIDSCYVGPPTFCKICADSESKRAQLCQKAYPGFTTRPGQGIPMDK